MVQLAVERQLRQRPLGDPRARIPERYRCVFRVSAAHFLERDVRCVQPQAVRVDPQQAHAAVREPRGASLHRAASQLPAQPALTGSDCLWAFAFRATSLVREGQPVGGRAQKGLYRIGK
jgi:hypothetical protein